MSHGIMLSGTGSQTGSCNYCTKPNMLASITKLEPASHLSFRHTHLPISNFSVKLRYGSSRGTPKVVSCSLHATTESFYDLLGISETGTILEIKQAYKRLVRRYHPDVSPSERIVENTKMFIQVQEAYETLSDPKSRAVYDGDLVRGLHRAFSARGRSQYSQNMSEKNEWRNQWQSQLAELERRNMNKDSRENMSWGARMRRQRCREADDLN
ncbi:hypothetical protein SLE2022_249040 [Rubroshorea leprosula]